MIQKNINIGNLFVTNAGFGHVKIGAPDFRVRFAGATKKEPKQVVWMDQVHGSNVKYLEEITEQELILPQTDGVITRQPEVMLITKTADCVPILLWSESDKTVAAVHCGWKGFFADILESFALCCQMNNLLLTDFYAYLGPHLRVRNFEVQADFIEKIPNDKKEFLEYHQGKAYYNLTLGVKTLLNSMGVTKIEDHGTDTFNSPDYFSYRAWKQVPVDKRPEHYNTFANCIILS